MKPPEFEIGKIYKGKSDIILVRIDEIKIVALEGLIGTTNIGGRWGQDYTEISIDDLTYSQREVYNKLFCDKTVGDKTVGCTCDMQKVIMVHGCQCGCIEKERANAHHIKVS